MLYDFTKDEYDIIIQAGQSNSYGCGMGDAENPYEDDDRVRYLTGKFMIQPACDQIYKNSVQGNYSLAFAREYIKAGLLKEGRKLLILRTSEGGTGFADHHWDETGDLFLRMLEMLKTALALNPANRAVALLWHQGENDIDANMSKEAYHAHLSGLIRSVRQTAGEAQLPFVCGDFTPKWQEVRGERCLPISGAQREICKADAAARFVETDGLLSNGEQHGNEDYVHFSRDALYRLGDRYFAAYADILANLG